MPRIGARHEVTITNKKPAEWRVFLFACESSLLAFYSLL